MNESVKQYLASDRVSVCRLLPDLIAVTERLAGTAPPAYLTTYIDPRTLDTLQAPADIQGHGAHPTVLHYGYTSAAGGAA
jgi:hypothetical protein